MTGHLAGYVNVATPVVFVAIDNVQEEQMGKPTKIGAFNFFALVTPGVHTVEVMAAAGSNIASQSYPAVSGFSGLDGLPGRTLLET
jgi:hypothetical protein